MSSPFRDHQKEVRVDYIMDFHTLDRLMKFPGVEKPYIIMSISLVH